jgi:hypothetical protein
VPNSCQKNISAAVPFSAVGNTKSIAGGVFLVYLSRSGLFVVKITTPCSYTENVNGAIHFCLEVICAFLSHRHRGRKHNHFSFIHHMLENLPAKRVLGANFGREVFMCFRTSLALKSNSPA